jgi:hypothetical protein
MVGGHERRTYYSLRRRVLRRGPARIASPGPAGHNRPGPFMQRRGGYDVKLLSMLSALAAGALIAAAPIAATAQQTAAQAGPQQRFANGTDWASSSVAEKRAFVFGIANAISAGIGWDERHIPASQMTFARRLGPGLADTSLGEAVRRIDAWYAANPGKQDTTVMAVMWLDIIKPRVGPSK